ncbi:3-oxoadipate enol-lactone hydrolase [Halobacteriales archaeon QS_1_68_20]|nr:MAG: 3-oxoadipate enol-lactone hydrolase [Halobacteriales archaeon QS_1_68_20]
MPVVRNGGVSVAYEATSPSDVETVAFVEGWSYGRWMWRWQREALPEYQRIVVDNRGTGDSEAPGLGMPGLLGKLPEAIRQPLIYLLHSEKYTIPQMAADLEVVLADAGVERAHVVGASMGGMIALQHALTYDRTASLTLMCTTAGGDMENLIPEDTMAHLESVPEGLSERERIKYLMEPATTEAWREDNADLLDRIVDWRLRQDASVPAREAQAVGQIGWDVRDRLGEVDVPTLVMHGTGDRVVPFERGQVLAEGLDCEFEVYEDAPHLLFIERAEEINDRLRAFLSEVDA